MVSYLLVITLNSTRRETTFKCLWCNSAITTRAQESSLASGVISWCCCFWKEATASQYVRYVTYNHKGLYQHHVYIYWHMKFCLQNL